MKRRQIISQIFKKMIKHTKISQTNRILYATNLFQPFNKMSLLIETRESNLSLVSPKFKNFKTSFYPLNEIFRTIDNYTQFVNI